MADAVARLNPMIPGTDRRKKTCEHEIAASGGLQQADLAGLNRALRRNINSARGHQRPIDLTRQRPPVQP